MNCRILIAIVAGSLGATGCHHQPRRLVATNCDAGPPSGEAALTVSHAAPVASAGDSVNVTMTVVDGRDTVTPIGYVAVSLQSGADTTVRAIALQGGYTNEQGQVWFRGVPPGPYITRARRIGYEPLTRAVVVGDSGVTLLRAAMRYTPVCLVEIMRGERSNDR